MKALISQILAAVMATSAYVARNPQQQMGPEDQGAVKNSSMLASLDGFGGNSSLLKLATSEQTVRQQRKCPTSLV